MSILDFFKKKSASPEPEPVRPRERYRSFDRIDVYYDQALRAYCETHGKTEDDLSEDQIDELWRYAGNHIGLFMTWIICNHFEGSIHQDIPEVLEQVRTGELLGVDFVLQYCDTKFWGEDFCDEIYDFVDQYYETQYFKEYSEWVVNELHDLPFELIATWKEYQAFAPVIDKAHEEFQNN